MTTAAVQNDGCQDSGCRKADSLTSSGIAERDSEYRVGLRHSGEALNFAGVPLRFSVDPFFGSIVGFGFRHSRRRGNDKQGHQYLRGRTAP
jgi:hypothetical protein